MSLELVVFLCVIAFALGFMLMLMSQRRRGKGYRPPPRTRRGIFDLRKGARGGGGGGGGGGGRRGLPASEVENPAYAGRTATQPAQADANRWRPVPDLSGSGTIASSNSTKGQPKCPYCQQPCDPSNAKFCPVCNTAHHKDCWQENSGCTRLSCTGKIARN